MTGASGVSTAAFTEGGYFSRRFGLDRGFDEYVEEEGEVRYFAPSDAGPPGEARPEATGGIAQTFAAARDWLARIGDERFFLLIHTYEVHTPYTRLDFADGLSPGAVGTHLTIDQLPRLKSGELSVGAGEIEYVRALYDGGVATADRHFGELRAFLRERGLADRTAVIVTSDHGEELGEHYPRHLGDHGHSLRDPLLWIPLIVFDPTRSTAVGEVDAQVRLVDVMPTVADLLGVSLSGVRDGASLRPLMAGDDDTDRIALAGQTWRGPRRGSVRALGYKYIRSAGDDDGTSPLMPPPPMQQLYDLGDDPGEHTNVAAQRPGLAGTLHEALLERIWSWKDDQQALIIRQQQQMGCSCDWDRQRFTLDPVVVENPSNDSIINRLIQWADD